MILQGEADLPGLCQRFEAAADVAEKVCDADLGQNEHFGLVLHTAYVEDAIDHLQQLVGIADDEFEGFVDRCRQDVPLAGDLLQGIDDQ